MESPSLMRYRTALLRFACVLGLVGGLAQPASALSPAATVRELARGLRPAGGASGAPVVDLGTGTTLYRGRRGVRGLPASVEKLYTTSTALLRLGEDARLRTEVSAVEPVGLDGTLHANLYPRGGGDPTLTTTGLQRLAASLVAATG